MNQPEYDDLLFAMVEVLDETNMIPDEDGVWVLTIQETEEPARYSEPTLEVLNYLTVQSVAAQERALDEAVDAFNFDEAQRLIGSIERSRRALERYS